MQTPTRKLKILFLCTGNSCRSQMAEGWAKALKNETLEAYSAGVEPHGMNPRAIQVMAEAGVDISHHTSKHVNALSHIPFDYVLTVCDRPHETCPLFPGPSQPKIIHVGFDDPPAVAQSATSDALSHYRRVRDQIKAWIQTLPESLMSAAA